MKLNQLPSNILDKVRRLQEQVEHFAHRTTELEHRLDYCHRVSRGDIQVNPNRPVTEVREEMRTIKQECVDLEPQIKHLRGRANIERNVLSRVKEWVAELPDDAVLEQVSLTITRGETVTGARDRIKAIEEELKALRQLPTPSPDLRKRIERYVKHLADPVVSGIGVGETLEVEWPDPLSLLAIQAPDKLVERIFDAALRRANDPLPLEQRRARIDKLKTDLEKIHYLEELLVMRAIANGGNVHRRLEVPPHAVLGVRVKEDVRRGTRRERRAKVAA